MIRSYRDRDTERLAAGEKVRKWEPFRRQAEKRLRILDAATALGDLAALNSNRLEALKGPHGAVFHTNCRLRLHARRKPWHAHPFTPARSSETSRRRSDSRRKGWPM